MLRRTCTLLAMTCLASPPAWALDITVDTVIDHGTVQQVADPITIGDGTTNPVTLTVRNPGTVVEASNNSGRFVFVGGDDSGRLVIENGARVGQLSFSGSRRTQMRVAQEGGTGEVIVDGAGSRLEAQSFELANEGGDGTLRVLDGGVVRFSPLTEFIWSVASNELPETVNHTKELRKTCRDCLVFYDFFSVGEMNVSVSFALR